MVAVDADLSHEFKGVAVGSQHQVLAIIKHQTAARNHCLARPPAKHRRLLEYLSVPSRALECEGGGQAGPARTHDGNARLRPGAVSVEGHPVFAFYE
jgi:hypothetical protein